MHRRVLNRQIRAALSRSLVSVVPVTILVACFDAEEVETHETRLTWPNVQRVDDFESGNGYPTWSGLNHWSCAAYPDAAAFECEDATHFGYEYHAGVLEFELGCEDYSGAMLQALAPTPLDLSGYDELVFAATVEPMYEGSLPSHVPLRVALLCEDVAAASTSPSGVVVMIEGGVNLVPGTVHRYALDLRRMRQPEWEVMEEQLERIDPNECLRNVTHLQIEIPAEPDQELAGRLILDDIDLYTLPDSDPPATDLPRLSPWRSCLATEGGVQLECAYTGGEPTIGFELEAQPGVAYPPAVWLCTNVVRVNPTTHQVEDASLDLTDHRLLRFDAQFDSFRGTPHPRMRARVALNCTGLLPTGDPYLHREITLEPGRSSYALPLDTFEVSPYPQQFDDKLGCLGQVGTLCFETNLQEGESAAGILTVDELAVE